MKHRCNVYCLVVIVMMLLLGCGGGSGDSSETTDVDTQVDPTLSLPGKLFYQEVVQYIYLVDLTTGLAELVPNTDWSSLDQRDLYFKSGVASFFSHPRKNNNSEFLLIAKHCKRVNSDPLSDEMSCLLIQDYLGNYISEIDIVGSIFDAKLSPDGRYIALYRKPYPYSDEWFEIYTRNGDLISDKKEEYSQFEWLNDGRIVTTYNRHFLFTEEHSTDSDYYLSLPDQIGNESIVNSVLGDYAISNDGMQVAFTLYHLWPSTNKYGDAVFIMNIDGTNIRKVAVSLGDTYQHIDSLMWSPDDRWVMVREGYTPSQDGNVTGTSGYLYAFPAENIGKVFSLSSIESKKSSEVIIVRRERTLSNASDQLTTSALNGTALEWIP
ncbi:MAG: hypothetical protein ABW170_15145 [Candidatus Thiodiazotropha sp. L084R]